MHSSFSKIGLIGKYGDPSVADTLLQLSELLIRRNCEVWLEDHTAQAIRPLPLPTASFDEIGKKCDFVKHV